LESEERQMTQEDHDLLVRVDEKLNRALKMIGAQLDDHEKRVRAVERFRWTMLGAGVIAGSYVGGVVTPEIAGAVTR
jgi:hypothetical protein